MVKQQVNDIGPAHFKSIIKQQRSNNYNLTKVLCEFIDNIIKKCDNINITTTLNDTKLYEIKISDNYEKGFENINEKGAKNPLNMGHIRDGQDDDNETSEFGIGMKAAAIASSNKFTIYTKVNDKYYKIYFDFIKMSQEIDIIKSYNPIIKNIDHDEYKEYHIYDNGSTLILEDIRDEIYSATTDETITQDIKIQLGSIYGKIINKYNINLLINDISIQSEYDFFEDEKCKIFTKSAKLYYLENNHNKIKLFLIEYPNNKYFVYKDKKIIQNKDNLKYYESNGFDVLYSMNNNNKECLIIDSTFTYFVNNKDIDKMTSDAVGIYKDDRKYSNLPLKKRNDGYHNYTIHKISFISKKIGKQLGMTYNKEILLSNNNNDLVNCVDTIISKNRSEFTTQKKSQKFKKLIDIYNKHFNTQYLDNFEIISDNDSDSDSDSDSDLDLDSDLESDTVSNIKDNDNNITNDNSITNDIQTTSEKHDNKINTIKIKSVKSKKVTKPQKIIKPEKVVKEQQKINTEKDKIEQTNIEQTNIDDITEENNNLNYFYLIHTAGKQHKDIYKIGKTSREPFKRIREYERGYKIYLVLKTNNNNFEDIVIENLKKSFTQETEFGKEWFSGDINKIIKCILDLYNQHELL